MRSGSSQRSTHAHYIPIRARVGTNFHSLPFLDVIELRRPAHCADIGRLDADPSNFPCIETLGTVNNGDRASTRHRRLGNDSSSLFVMLPKARSDA